MRRLLRAFYRTLIGVAVFGAVSVGVFHVAYPHLSPDAQQYPIYVKEFFTNPNFVVNTPVVHEIFGTAVGVPDEGKREERLRVPDGYRLSVFASGIPHPRMLRLTSSGDLLVTQPRKGRVLLLTRDADADGRSDGTRILLDGLSLPHGIELRDGRLYVAESTAISRAPFDERVGELLGPLERIVSLPEINFHHSRVIRFGPDGWLYYAIGAFCNVCEATGVRDQALLRVRSDGSDEEVVASGFRNIMGFDWKPDTRELFAGDAGGDYLGEDFPPEELNKIEPGAFYGFPYAHGDGRPDPEFGADNEARIGAARSPVRTFPAHSTPLGMTFLRSPEAPVSHQGALLLALHGSWNRTRKVGYKVISLHWLPDGTIEERDFLAGFEQDEDVIGRPVGVYEGSDGAVYVSDDYAGAVYRVSRVGAG